MDYMADLSHIKPEIIMSLFAMGVLLLDLFMKKKEQLAYITIGGAVITAWAVSQGIGPELSKAVAFGGMFTVDGYAVFCKVVFLISLVLSVLISIRYIKDEDAEHGEYYSLMLFATLGMMIMASATDLSVLYLGLELMALSTYILAGFKRKDVRSNEAAVKYFLLGAFASAFLLYAISLTYGSTGTTDIAGIAAFLKNKGGDNPVLMLAVAMFVVAFGFKVAAAPFHMWAPDVYEGAPTSVTAFMSVGPKAAGFAVMGRVLFMAFPEYMAVWHNALLLLAVLTMAAGNVLALTQTNIKRMLAYSSIAHAGYLLIGVATGSFEGLASMLNYLFIYAFMNIGAFGLVIMLQRKGERAENINDFNGLSKTHPVAALLMLVFMFSLTGIPPTAGFIAKFYLFMAAINANFWWVVVAAVFFSSISAYYYLRIVMYMYMREPDQEITLSQSPSLKFTLIFTSLAVLVLGLLPANVLDMAKFAAMSLVDYKARF